METAITARLYFVLFSGAANSNNKLSPILPLQPATPRLCRSLRSRQQHHPFPLFVSLASVHRALPSSFERFVSRTFPERPRFLSSSRLLRYTPTLPPLAAPSSIVARCSVALGAMEFLRLAAGTTWKGTSYHMELFGTYERS